MPIQNNAKTSKQGTLILVTGPSGCGKDTLLHGARIKLAGNTRVVFARRVITRPADAGGEPHFAVSLEEFLQRKAAGEFWTDWMAHGLHYALPRTLLVSLQQGSSVLANISRTMVSTMAELWPQTALIQISAPAEQVNQRLNQRGRESSADIKQRLQRQVPPAPASVPTIEVVNDAAIETGIDRFYQAVMDILAQ